MQPSEQLAPEYAGIEAGLRSEFASTSVDATRLYREFIDLDFGQPVDRRIFADYLRAKYADVGIDAVVALSDEAVRFVTEHRDAIGDAPLVFTTADRTAVDTIPKSSSVVVPLVPSRTVELALLLQP
ncbi:MAG TPA: hypothetical protein VGL98_11950, partial [Gammaproteobacteria bacterium]